MAHQHITVCFVPGAFHSPDGYDQVISSLNKAGFNTAKVSLPSVLRNQGPVAKNFDSDVKAIRESLGTSVRKGQKVILVMHSYSGIPGSQAVEGLEQATLAAQGHTDGRGVIHLVYLAAFLLQKGQSLTSAVGGEADWIEKYTDGTGMPKDPGFQFYNDFESPEQVKEWVANLAPLSLIVHEDRVTYEPWRTIPTTYLGTERDNAIPYFAQKMFVNAAIEAGASDLRWVSWDTGHTPFGTRPSEVAQLIRSAVGNHECLSHKEVNGTL